MEVSTFKFADGRDPLALNPGFSLPDDTRPHLSEVLPLTMIPIIDLNEDNQSHSSLVKKISKACEEYGFFHIINHGVPNELCKSMIDAVAEFFHLPPKERSQIVTGNNLAGSSQIYHSSFVVNDKEKVPYWTESLTHPVYPSEGFGNLLPKNPPHYRELVTEYMKQMVGLVPRLLSLISEGLGLKSNCLQEIIKDTRLNMHAHYCPPHADPEATLGLGNHTDINTFTIIQQCDHVVGLQILKAGKWVAIEPVPNAIVINIGDQMEIMSNGKYKSRLHRTVANKHVYRTSIAMFCAANPDALIGPIEDLISEENPPLYRNYFYREYVAEFQKRKESASRLKLKETFEIKH